MKTIQVRRETLIPQLRKIPLLRYLSDGSLSALIDDVDFVECPEGEHVTDEGTIEPWVFVILEGACAVMVDHGDGPAYVSTVGPGQTVGEAAIFVNYPRTATVVAQETVRLMRFERTRFIARLRAEPENGMRILFALVHTLLSRLRETNLELAFERRDFSAQDDIDAMINDLLDGR